MRSPSISAYTEILTDRHSIKPGWLALVLAWGLVIACCQAQALTTLRDLQQQI